ncbi:MAG TPA: hypothetical protein VLG76_03485 [Rhabdochlamydiaceae bacterium]|nr:hypothetical protein [Rhabdochlamydiaceae bacterium]
MASAVNGGTGTRETFIETEYNRSNQKKCGICKEVNPPNMRGITTSYFHNDHFVHSQCEEQRLVIGLTCSCGCKITHIQDLQEDITEVYQGVDLIKLTSRIENKISALLRSHPLLYIPAIILGPPAVILAMIALCLFVLIYGIIGTGLVIYDSFVDCAKKDKSEAT